MPSTSRAQQVVMALAEHSPEKLYARNKGAAEMTHQQLHDFAATPTKHLPEHVKHEYSGASYKMAHGARQAE